MRSPVPTISRRSFTQTSLATGIALAIGAPLSARAAGKLKVVATFSILGDWVRQVGGDAIDLSVIVPADGDAHAFDPKPDQVASVADAAVLFEIGLDFETWLEDMVSASGSSATRVPVSTGITLLAFDEHTGEEHEEESGEHEHGATDPHIWGNVANAINAVELIRAALTDAGPDQTNTFAANAAAYTETLKSLDTTIRDQVATLPEDRRKLVTTHDTFGYYADAYGFEIVGTALNSLSTEGGDPPASEIASLVDSVTSANVPAIFADNVTNPDLMETIADEAGVTLAPALYTDALGANDADGATYEAMMTYNTTTIVTALA